MFDALPSTAAWLHRDARTGFEVANFSPFDGGYVIEGCTAAIEDGRTWVVNYELRVDRRWRTRRAVVSTRTATGSMMIRLNSRGDGRWTVDDVPTPLLDGCLDVDLEASAFTNALPIRRREPHIGDRFDAPAVYVHAADVTVDRLEQQYTRIGLDSADAGQQYVYAAPVFDFACDLTYDAAGLLLHYPGIAERAG